jgi:hypothetical protein
MFFRTINALKLNQLRFNNEKNKICKLRPLWETNNKINNIGSIGDEKVNKFLWLLDNMGYTRNEDQIEFHRHLFLATIDKFYGQSWSSEMHRIMKLYKIYEIQRHVIMLARRRLGKTVAVCLFQAAMMICIGGETAIVLATNQRISLMIMEQVRKMINTQYDSRGQHKKSGEKLTYFHIPIIDELFTVNFLEDKEDLFNNGKDKTESKLMCYPGSQSKSKF